jgi:hypothetical protein
MNLPRGIIQGSTQESVKATTPVITLNKYTGTVCKRICSSSITITPRKASTMPSPRKPFFSPDCFYIEKAMRLKRSCIREPIVECYSDTDSESAFCPLKECQADLCSDFDSDIEDIDVFYCSK